jgi:CRP/FNR family transcriptional regulator, cyclic AMP receptor protein
VSIYSYQLFKGLGLSKQRVVALLPSVKAESLLPNQFVCRMGSPPKAWFHVLTGLVCASVPGQGGGVAPMLMFGPGSWFGEAPILNRVPSGVDCVCLTPVRMLSLPIEQFNDAFDNEPQFSRYIARLLAWRTQQQLEMLTLARLGTPQLRVVVGLAMFAEALHTSNSHLPTCVLDDGLKIPLKQSLLASLCGVSRGVFSESVQQLAAAGWLTLNYATLELSHEAVWRKFCSQYRQNQFNIAKPSMPDILLLLETAAVDMPQAQLPGERRARAKRQPGNRGTTGWQ